MRDLLNRLSQHETPALFLGQNEPGTIVVPDGGLLLGTFDQATAMGRFVHECRVDLRRGADQPRYEGNLLRCWDAGRLTVLNTYDTHCPEPLDEEQEMRQALMEFSPVRGSHVCMVTGRLAHAGLARIMKALDPQEFTYEIRVLDKAVAAWFDCNYVAEQIGDLTDVDLVLLPGKTQGDEAILAQQLGCAVQRGTACYSELPTFFEMAGVEVEADGIVKPRVVMLGRPGSGKTTYAAEIAQTYEVPHISVGDIIRAGIEDGDETAIEARDCLGRGELVPHNVMAELVRSRILMPDMRNGFVLDGYPRILRDADWLVDMGVRPDAIVYCACSAKEAKRRLLAKRQTNYVGIGAAIGEFEAETMQLVDHYRAQSCFIEINTEEEDVMTTLYTGLEAMFRTCLLPNQES